MPSSASRSDSLVAHAAGPLVRAPALRLFDQVLPPQRAAVDLARLERRVEAVGDDGEAVVVEVEELRGAAGSLRRVRDEPVAPPSPAADALSPLLGVAPALGRSLGDPLEHQELGAVDVADHRDVGELAGGRLVHRRQVVEVEDVGVGGSRLVELARPSLDLELEALVVEAGEDGVLGSRPVLEGARASEARPRSRMRSAARWRAPA